MENLAATLNHRGKRYSLKELGETVNLTELEKNIIKNRSNGLSFSQLSEKQNQSAVDQIMLIGAAISGSALPNTDFFASVIGSEISIFLNEFGYSEYTLAEILFSLRMNARGGIKYPSGIEVDIIHFTGVYLNIDYLSKVLNSYTILRNILDRKLQNQIDGY